MLATALLPQLLYTSVPGILDLYDVNAPTTVPTLMAYWSTTRNNSLYFLKTFDANVALPVRVLLCMRAGRFERSEIAGCVGVVHSRAGA